MSEAAADEFGPFPSLRGGGGDGSVSCARGVVKTLPQFLHGQGRIVLAR